MVEEGAGDPGVVSFGTTVVVADDAAGGREATYTLVGPTETDRGSGRISSESPVAQELMGAARARSSRSPRQGARHLRVVRLGG